MDAGVVSGLLQIATQEILLDKKLPRSQGAASKGPPAASGCGGAGPSAASALLSDAQRHRPRRASLHPAPRRSQRRLTPFFHGPLALAALARVPFAACGGGGKEKASASSPAPAVAEAPPAAVAEPPVESADNPSRGRRPPGGASPV